MWNRERGQKSVHSVHEVLRFGEEIRKKSSLVVTRAMTTHGHIKNHERSIGSFYPLYQKYQRITLCSYFKLGLNSDREIKDTNLMT